MITLCLLYQYRLHNRVNNNLGVILDYLQYYIDFISHRFLTCVYSSSVTMRVSNGFWSDYKSLCILFFVFSFCPVFFVFLFFFFTNDMFIFGSQTMLHAVNHKKFTFLEFTSKALPDLSKCILKCHNAFPLCLYLELWCFKVPSYRGRQILSTSEGQVATHWYMGGHSQTSNDLIIFVVN